MINKNKDFRVEKWMLIELGCKHKTLVFAFIYAFNDDKDKSKTMMIRRNKLNLNPN